LAQRVRVARRYRQSAAGQFIAVVLVMTACPNCGADPCANPDFCRACRDADGRKTRLRYAPSRPAPLPLDLPKADLEGKNWQEIAADAWSCPGWRQAALEYQHARGNHVLLIVETPSEDLARLRRLMSDEVSHEHAWDEINRAARERYNEAPEATYNAIVYELHTYGLPQLSNLSCQRQLADLSAAQIKAVIASLQAGRNQYPKVNDELLTTLGEIYDMRMAFHAQ